MQFKVGDWVKSKNPLSTWLLPKVQIVKIDTNECYAEKRIWAYWTPGDESKRWLGFILSNDVELVEESIIL